METQVVEMQKYFVDKQIRLTNKSFQCVQLKRTTTMTNRASKPGVHLCSNSSAKKDGGIKKIDNLMANTVTATFTDKGIKDKTNINEISREKQGRLCRKGKKKAKEFVCQKTSLRMNLLPKRNKNTRKRLDQTTKKHQRKVLLLKIAEHQTRSNAVIGQGKITRKVDNNHQTNRGLTTIKLRPKSQVESNNVETAKKIRRHRRRRGRRGIKLSNPCLLYTSPSPRDS